MRYGRIPTLNVGDSFNFWTAEAGKIENGKQYDEISLFNIDLCIHSDDWPCICSVGGTWYIGGKYRNYWRALAPMSGPFVQESGYPWDSLRQMSFFVTEGTQTPSLDGSRAVRDWMNKHGFRLKYKEVNADHGGMIKLVLPDIFDFFDSCRTNSVGIFTKRTASLTPHATEFSVKYVSPQLLRIFLPTQSRSSKANVSILDIIGRKHDICVFSTIVGEVGMNCVMLPAGAYRAWVRTDSWNGCAAFMVVR